MKNQILALFSILFFLSCSKTDSPDLPTIPKVDNPAFSSSNFRGGNPQIDYCIGKGYDMTLSNGSSILGVSEHLNIIDLDRATKGIGYDYRNAREYNAKPLELDILDVDNSPRLVEGSMYDNNYTKHTFKFHGTVSFLGLTSTYHYFKNVISEGEFTTKRFRINRLTKSLNLSLLFPTDLDPYLNKNFYERVHHMRSSDLVKTYGTHIITNYKYGAYLDISILASKKYFSEDEFNEITFKYLTDSTNLDLSHSTTDKLKKYSEYIKVYLDQVGGDYVFDKSINNFSVFAKLVTSGNVFYKEWLKTVVGKPGGYCGVDGKLDFYPLYKIVKDPLMKVKLFAAFYEKVNENVKYSSLNYLLSDPVSFRPVKFDSQPMFLTLKNLPFDHDSYYIFYGDYDEVINDFDIDKSLPQGRETLWSVSQNSHDCSFTFYSDKSKKYLCRDLKMRTIPEDSDGLRFWALNPIMNTQSSVNINNTLIKY